MLAFTARQGFGFHQRLRQQRGPLVVAGHLPQVGLFDVIQIFAFGITQPVGHLCIGQDLVLQDAQLCQRFASRGTAACGHHGKHVPTGNGGEVREAGETLEGTGELLIIILFH